MVAVLDPYLPHPDVRRRHSIVIHAPPDLVLAVARSFDINSIPLVRAHRDLLASRKASPRSSLPIRQRRDWLTGCLN
ncbi:MAG: hypothetical protein R2748_16715 [Bryobacterales bacterium]